jgi:hypothetical protein
MVRKITLWHRKGGEMTNLLDKITKCNHKGQYNSAGLLPVETPNGMFVIAVLYCKHCGQMELKANRLEVKGKLPTQTIKKEPVDYRSPEEKMYDERMAKSKSLDNKTGSPIGQDNTPKQSN